MVNDELIQRFFSDRCTPEEAALVADHLREHPDVLERYMSEKDFVEMKETGDLPAAVSAKWLQHIHAVSQGPGVYRIWGRRLAAAAVAGGIIFGGALLFRAQQKPSLAGIRPETVIVTDQQVKKVNSSATVMPVELPDGSSVRLMPKAIAIYDKKFTDKRDVFLEGEADFEVVKDKLHAFTVYTGEIATRVLGTSFRVKAIREEDLITVRLNEGRVLVRADLHRQEKMKDVPLEPGQELRYSKATGMATVSRFAVPSVDALVRAGSDEKRGMPRPDWYKFSSQPMSAVLDQLGNYYGVAIYYHPADIKKLYFEGKFEKTDSLEKILTDITLPNNLKFVREGGAYIIKKR